MPRSVTIKENSLDPKYIEVLQRANNLLPRAKFKILPDVGHALHIENPKLFLETIEDFLYLS